MAAIVRCQTKDDAFVGVMRVQTQAQVMPHRTYEVSTLNERSKTTQAHGKRSDTLGLPVSEQTVRI